MTGMARARGLATVILLSSAATASLAAESRFSDVRLIVGRHGQSLLHNPGFDEIRGTLVVDTEAGRLRFEAGSRSVLDVPFDAIVNLHFEESSDPRRAFRRRGLYLTVHHTDAAGVGDVAIFRLSKETVETCLAAVARATGKSIDRRPQTTSFSGLPIHTGVGDTVYLTTTDGRRTKSVVTKLGLREISLGSGRFDANSVSRIDVADPVWGGAVFGAGVAFIPAGFLSWGACLESCSTLGPLTAGGWGVVAAGAVIGAMIDQRIVRHAFRRDAAGQARAVQWEPLPARGTAGLELRLSF